MKSLKKVLGNAILLGVLSGFSIQAAAEDFSCTIKSPDEYAGKSFDIISQDRHSKTVVLNGFQVPSELTAISMKYVHTLEGQFEHYDSVSEVGGVQDSTV